MFINAISIVIFANGAFAERFREKRFLILFNQCRRPRSDCDARREAYQKIKNFGQNDSKIKNFDQNESNRDLYCEANSVRFNPHEANDSNCDLHCEANSVVTLSAEIVRSTGFDPHKTNSAVSCIFVYRFVRTRPLEEILEDCLSPSQNKIHGRENCRGRSFCAKRKKLF